MKLPALALLALLVASCSSVPYVGGQLFTLSKGDPAPVDCTCYATQDQSTVEAVSPTADK